MIYSVREALITDLAATELTVHGPYPKKVEPPALVVLPEAPYITGGSRFGSYVVHLAVVILSSRTDDPLGVLDDMIEAVLANTVDWALSSVDSPSVPTDRPDLLVTTVHLAKEIP